MQTAVQLNETTPPLPYTGSDKVLKAEWIDTRLGPMMALADEDALYMLEFAERKELERGVEDLQMRLNTSIAPGRTSVTESIEGELHAYFDGTLQKFETPVSLTGTDFQKAVWESLRAIPYGETRSYSQQAQTLGRPEAVRAVAQSNSRNRLAVIVPCHRVIGADGGLTGYAGGLERKKRLLEHEQASEMKGNKR